MIPPHTNRLAREKSPYLLQHQHNPVDWFPWGEEAFARARAENKPIFLSIGYSTCHWCHVMERESFEDDAIAAFLNAHFVSIKVDREERPDVDKIYMTSVQAMTRPGRLAAQLFSHPGPEALLRRHLFPAGQPSRAGPASSSSCGRSPGSGSQRHGTGPGDRGRFPSASSRPTLAREPGALDAARAAALEQRRRPVQAASTIRQFGGFGAAPKFPRPSQPAFLLRHGRPRRRRRGRPDGPAHLRTHGRRRHPRPARRRLRPLFAWMPNGSCRTSRRCSMTTPNW